jgi:VIT1/CCC1 family predicted Fe2+/Mn2+ transporter
MEGTMKLIKELKRKIEKDLSDDKPNELLVPVTEGDLMVLKYWVGGFVVLCALFGIGSFIRNDMAYTFAFLILAAMIGIIYYAILPGPLGWKVATTVLFILLFALMAIVAPSTLEMLLSKVPFIGTRGS